MRIAIASGKGGTGKTTVSVALARTAEGPVQLLDCDVEAPNAHLFLKPAEVASETVSVSIPRIDANLCDGCGECSAFCAYNAIVMAGKRAMVFPELCHACGGCARVCPRHAIGEVDRPIGAVESGQAGRVDLVSGRLNVGVAMAPPLIRAVLGRADEEALTLVDGPPGTSCPMVTAVRGADYVVVVTEPTPFGLHDLTLAAETLLELGLPFGVVINRAGMGDERAAEFCEEAGIPVLLQIPHDRRIAEACSRGESIVDALPAYRPVFERLWERLVCAARGPQRPAFPQLRVHPGSADAG